LTQGKQRAFSASSQSTTVSTVLPRMERDLPLPKTPKGTILAPQRPGIRGMSDNMLRWTRRNFLILALSLAWLFAITAGAHSEEPGRAAVQATTPAEQYFAEFLKAEEQATKHLSDVIKHALTIFTWIVGVVGGLLVGGAALLGWAIARWSRTSKTDIEKEVKTQLRVGVTETIESESKETQRRITQLTRETDEFSRQLDEAKNRVNSAENTLTDLQLVAPLVLSEPQRRHLLNLYSGRTTDYVGNHNVRTELRRLRYVRLIKNSQPIGSARARLSGRSRPAAPTSMPAFFCGSCSLTCWSSTAVAAPRRSRSAWPRHCLPEQSSASISQRTAWRPPAALLP
jgi:hypothetical protein